MARYMRVGIILITLWASILLLWPDTSNAVIRTGHQWKPGRYMEETRYVPVKPAWACNRFNHGQKAAILDPYLKAYVWWICWCREDGIKQCAWRRILPRFTPSHVEPFFPYARIVWRHATDYHRNLSCESVFCIRKWSHDRRYKILIRNW